MRLRPYLRLTRYQLSETFPWHWNELITYNYIRKSLLHKEIPTTSRNSGFFLSDSLSRRGGGKARTHRDSCRFYIRNKKVEEVDINELFFDSNFGWSIYAIWEVSNSIKPYYESWW